MVPQRFRLRGIAVALLIPLKAILELVGIAVLLPLMLLLLDKQAFNGSSLEKLFLLTGMTDEMEFSLFIIIGAVVLLVVKSIVSIWIVNYQQRYLLSLYRYYSTTLFKNLYNKGLLFIKGSNTSELTFNVNGVCYNYVLSYIGGIIRIGGDLLLVLMVLMVLLFYSPVSAGLSFLVFIPATAIYLFLVRKPLQEYGSLENKAKRRQYRIVQETFRGFSEIEIDGAFPYIERRFGEGLIDISQNRLKYTVVQSIPSYLMEIVIVVVMAVLMLYTMKSDESGGIIFLSVFSVALLKMLPSVRRILAAWSSIKASSYSREVVSQIEDESTYTDSGLEYGEIHFDKVITLSGVTFSFGDEKVLDNITFEIRKGEVLGIAGRTGAGKTTLFNILLGLFPPQGGRVEVDGVPLSGSNIHGWHKLVGYVPQDVFISDTTILENVALGHSLDEIDRDRVVEALRDASLLSFVESLPNGVETRIGEAGGRISGGQKQRLGIARALYKQAEVLFFDEATSSLDSVTEMEVNEAVRRLSDGRRELTIIVISHRQSTLSFCDRVIDITAR